MKNNTHVLKSRQGDPENLGEQLQEDIITGITRMLEEDQEKASEEIIVALFVSMVVNTGACIDCTMAGVVQAVNIVNEEGIMNSCSNIPDKHEQH